jgi:hypothetical protein
MGKKFWIAFPVTFILLYFLEFVYNALILSGFYNNHREGFLSDEVSQTRMGWMAVGFLIWAFLWTYFFHRFATKKNVANGIRHGVSYMIFLFVPLSFINYSVLSISGWCYFWWAVGAIIEGAIIGAVMGAIMKEKTEV